MTDLKNQLLRLLADEPAAPDDLERIVSAGRRARRRHQAAVVTAGTLGAASVGAAVAVPMLAFGGNGHDVKVGIQSPPTSKPTPTASVPAGHCDFVLGSGNVRDALKALHKKADAAGVKQWKTKKLSKLKGHTLLEVCPKGVPFENPQAAVAQDNQPPAGPPYKYSEDPSAIASRLGAHLHSRVTDFGLTIRYTRPFAQESANMDKGHPSYFGGNVDIHESNGYGDIGVQVTHETTEQVPFSGDCTAADNCVETTLPDGSVLRTGQVDAGRGDTILTAEVHRPDGMVVQAQESDYPFGPDAGTQQHGDQPLSPKQLVSLATDPEFTF